jgi:NADP-dependent 3-hydroxy acid dehydrogenase YdfG
MKQLSILISGSGSGMGLLTAQTLIKSGHHVFAGVRDFKNVLGNEIWYISQILCNIN